MDRELKTSSFYDLRNIIAFIRHTTFLSNFVPLICLTLKRIQQAVRSYSDALAIHRINILWNYIPQAPNSSARQNNQTLCARVADETSR